MALAIRLSRGGRKARPFYRIVVADKRMPRDGRYIEKVGTYNPLLDDQNEQRVQLVEERIKYWLSQGAKPSERVAIFLGKAGLIDMPAQPVRPQKSEPSDKTKQMVADKEEKRKAAAEAAKEAEETAKADAEAEAAAAAEAAPAEEQAEAAEEAVKPDNAPENTGDESKGEDAPAPADAEQASEDSAPVEEGSPTENTEGAPSDKEAAQAAAEAEEKAEEEQKSE